MRKSLRLRVLRDDRVLDQCQVGLGAGQHAAPLLLRAVELVTAGRRNDGMRAVGKMPVGPHLLPQRVGLLLRVGQRKGDVGEARRPPLLLALYITCRITAASRSKQVLPQWSLPSMPSPFGSQIICAMFCASATSYGVPSRTSSRKLKPALPSTAPGSQRMTTLSACCARQPAVSCPQLALLVVDQAAGGPGQQRRQDVAHALAAARRRDDDAVLRPVMAEVVDAALRIRPAADIDPG